MKTYGNSEVVTVTELKKDQVIHLTQIGVVKPYEDHLGRGKARKYSRENLIEFLVCRELLKLRIETQLLRVVLESLRTNSGIFDMRYAKESAWKNKVLVFLPERTLSTGQAIAITKVTKEKLPQFIEKVPSVFVLNLAELINELDSKL